MQTMQATTAATSITGSASMKTGIFPAVSVTMVDKSTTKAMPETRMISPVCSLFFLLAIK